MRTPTAVARFRGRGVLPADAARAMVQGEHGGAFSMDASVRIEAADRAGRERLLCYCALDRLRELDPKRLLYEGIKPGPGGGPLFLTPLERIAAPVSPPRIHRHRYFSVLARTAAHGKFPRRPRTAGGGRSATFKAEREPLIVEGRITTQIGPLK